MRFELKALLRHASDLQRATSLEELLRTTHDSIRAVTRYRNSWISLFDTEQHVRVLRAGDAAQKNVSHYPLLPRAGDALLEELSRARDPVVVIDARLDPRPNPDVVKALDNRTIVEVPMHSGEGLLGALGVGTYGDEGVLIPSDSELEHLELFAAQLGNAMERIQLLEAHARDVDERHVLERHLEGLQRGELLGLLASGVAHELNNNLAIVTSSLRSLDGSVLSPDDREALKDSLDAADKAIDVVSGFRTLGRLNPSRCEEIDLNARVKAALKMVRASVPKGILVEHQAGPAPYVAGDPEQLEHALASLVIHARDSLGSRGVIRVRVGEQHFDEGFCATHRWARPGRFARVTVQDTGPGLPSEVVERISDPLFLKSLGSSLSVGLAVVSRVVQHHDGLVCCESVPGDGTRLHVYLPATTGT
jgi:signal transduction histidine kinase